MNQAGTENSRRQNRGFISGFGCIKSYRKQSYVCQLSKIKPILKIAGYLTWLITHVKSFCNPDYFLPVEGQETYEIVGRSLHTGQRKKSLCPKVSTIIICLHGFASHGVLYG